MCFKTLSESMDALFQSELTGDEEIEQSDVVNEVAGADYIKRDVTRQS